MQKPRYDDTSWNTLCTFSLYVLLYVYIPVCLFICKIMKQLQNQFYWNFHCETGQTPRLYIQVML